MSTAHTHPLQQDLHPPLSSHEAAVESDRCYFCHDAPCLHACPTGIDIPLFIRQIATGNTGGAARTIFDENILGGMCARVCPTEELCEQACVRNTAEDKPVRIGELQRYATDTLMATGRQPYRRSDATGHRVAVVGAGPAGLACAHRLALYGHEVDILDARPKPGGLNEYGIAAYKAVDDFAQREVAYIVSIGGITLRHEQALGSEFTLSSLTEEYAAVFLGLGLGGVNRLDIEGESLIGVDDAIDFIARLRQTDDPENLPLGRRTLVIGGGMTAIDASVQSRLLGCEEVTLVYRRGAEQMKASQFEQDLARTRGVVIRTGLQPVRVLSQAAVGNDAVNDGVGADRVGAVEFARIGELAGAFSPTGETVVIPCDRVLKAIGQKFLPQALQSGNGPVPDLDSGRIRVDDQRRTSLSGVWAGGDCIAGGEDLTVAAVQDGKLAAESIHSTLTEGAD